MLRKKRRISRIQQKMDELQEELNTLMGIRKRSLRIVGTAPAGKRQWGMKERGRIFGCLPAAAVEPCECESSCGLTDTSRKFETTLYISRSLCYKSYASGAPILTCTLNLAAPASVVVMAAVVSWFDCIWFDIQRPLGTSIVDQRFGGMFGRTIDCGDRDPYLNELEGCEVLPAGAYTWTLVTTLAFANVYASWIKAREITCLPV